MTFQAIISYIYLLSLLFASLCSLRRIRTIDAASKIIAILVCCAFINECTAYYLAKKYHNNLPLYTIYSFFEFGILCLYFSKIIDVFIKKKIGIYIGILGIILGILNLIFLQHLYDLNSYFLLFESLSVIGMALFAFFRMLLKQDSLKLNKYPHFWFTSILLFFWSITFLSLGLYEYINTRLHRSIVTIDTALDIIGCITYIGLGCVFLLYPKMQKHK